ncbi:hypothetical protein [Kribbella sp. NPDC048915]|uniref:hypothetical protein n=1 Tax=Kribbella sp. NPDC048915 TaxID=3155148 RepID=UPI00340951DD
MTRRWLIDLPTRIHLWSAELLIRHRPSADPDRLRNLDVLREYRRSRAFPRNDTALRSTPYFVDRAGRHCAVAHLMRASGEDDAVRRIAATANLARIGDMNPADLAWARRSGLTTRELARIQPQYTSTAQAAVNLLLWTALVMVPFAILSVLLGRIRRERAALRAGLIVATVTGCTALSFLAHLLLLGSLTRGDYLTLVWLAWIVVIAGPVLAGVGLFRLVRFGRLRTEDVASVVGFTAGSLMTLLAGIYVLAGVVHTRTYEPPPDPMMDAGTTFFLPVGVGTLLIGLCTLAWTVYSTRRTVHA